MPLPPLEVEGGEVIAWAWSASSPPGAALVVFRPPASPHVWVVYSLLPGAGGAWSATSPSSPAEAAAAWDEFAARAARTWATPPRGEGAGQTESDQSQG